MKKFFMTKEGIDKRIHKIYLVLALIVGISLSVAMPLFNEPDGQYHYTAATNMAGLTNDLSAYGESEIVTGINQQIIHYQEGNFFETYFKNKIKLMPMEDLPRLNYIPSKKGYNYWGHLLPTVGVWLGHALYPSIGVMVVVARLLSTLICSLAMFFIIKWVKAGKLLFFAVSLSPVSTNTFASLSYDATTYVLAALVVAAAINIVVRQRVVLLDFVFFATSSVILWFGAKTNIRLLIALIPFVIFITLIRKKEISPLNEIDNYTRRDKRRKYSKVPLIIVGTLLIVAILVVMSIFKPTLLFSFYRIGISHLINVTPGLDVSSIFQSLLAAPYASINYIPFWVSSLWYILLVLIVLVEKKYVWSSWISWFSFILFLAGLGAVYYSFVIYVGQAPIVSSSRMIGAVVGVQGRYFTPTLLLFSLFGANKNFTFKLESYRLVTIFAIFVVVVSNAMLLFGTLLGIYYLS
ncbi:DUF2142 domain-containing protein [Lactococcus lactis]|uniref:DUF2142 domain-containing protein n=1 Tax=Lactococcus lactis TaxID=1358 RepID=UPI0017858FF7|nr:DUF2142 domain-containing protein [Lactococcus lactis]MBD5854202.1 DUF2142 domain-containing protein [Lactococcus lactis]